MAPEISSRPRTLDPATLLPRVVSGTLAFTFANAGYCDYVVNLVQSIRRARCSWEPVVFCLDHESVTSLSAHGITCEPFFSEVASSLEAWGSASYKRLVFTKLDIFCSLLRSLREAAPQVAHLLYLDSDVVVLKDPLPYLVAQMSQPGAPITLFQCGEPASTCTNPAACPNCCTGVVFTKIAPRALEIFGYSGVDPATTSLDGDQDHVNAQLRRLDWERAYPRRTLPMALFPNGTQRDVNLPEKYLVHYNYVISHDKRAAMAAGGFWFTPGATGRFCP